MAGRRDERPCNRLFKRERRMSGLELNWAVWAFGRRGRKVRVSIRVRSALAHVHCAVVAAAPAAARGQARLSTGRNQGHDRPKPVQENETNAHDATHGALS